MIGLLALVWGRVDLPWVSPILLENRQNGKEGHGSIWEQEKVRHSNKFSMPPPPQGLWTGTQQGLPAPPALM